MGSEDVLAVAEVELLRVHPAEVVAVNEIDSRSEALVAEVVKVEPLLSTAVAASCQV